VYLSVSTVGYFRRQDMRHLSQAFIAITDPRDVVGLVDGWIQAAPRTDRVMRAWLGGSQTGRGAQRFQRRGKLEAWI
jgi:hypothetical protein